ncbi:MAG: hypothetical protein JWL68_587 [Actinomycetia bacterium]|nr:hypothetical protein [Actinomycetes bacterium]
MSEVLARLRRGETVDMTERGSLIARSVPAGERGPTSILEGLVAPGRATPARRPGTVHPCVPRMGLISAPTRNPSWRGGRSTRIISDTCSLSISTESSQNMTRPGSDTAGLARADLVRVLESAARLQEVVPDAVLVGGSEAALWANHRSSYDHDHVLADLSARFDAVLDAIEATDGWVTNRVTPGKIILRELGDIESGVRQLIRNRPLEVAEVALPSGHVLRVPTADETLRIKGYLVVRRNHIRDYIDVAALSDRCGISHAADVLRHIDDYYSDQRGAENEGVATQLARQLADPRPADARTIKQLRSYKDLDARWADWGNVTAVCRSLAVEMVA